MATCDEFIPEPTRDVDKPFLMPVEDVFSIAGRGTVVTGRVEQGKINVGDNIDVVGLNADTKTTCTGETRGVRGGGGGAKRELIVRNQTNLNCATPGHASRVIPRHYAPFEQIWENVWFGTRDYSVGIVSPFTELLPPILV